jgi:hypothetical protein
MNLIQAQNIYSFLYEPSDSQENGPGNPEFSRYRCFSKEQLLLRFMWYQYEYELRETKQCKTVYSTRIQQRELEMENKLQFWNKFIQMKNDELDLYYFWSNKIN